ncbi:MAG: hypothetical protein HKP55_08290 [Gammaproteobacteria bacterium]|nr:hypothetical protein [Gammaproteobacteria bacterium]
MNPSLGALFGIHASERSCINERKLSSTICSVSSRQSLHFILCTVFFGFLWPLHLAAGSFPVLVDGNWLVNNKTHVVLDVRTRDEYTSGHWPQSRWAGFKELDWQVKRYGLPGYLPNEKQLSTLLGGLGLQGSEAIVVIGSAQHPERIAEAARIIWSLMMAGFQQVALLDGGIESLSVDVLVTEDPVVNPTVCSINLQQQYLADSLRVEGMLDDNGIVVDFRPTLYFEGYKRNSLVPMPGTILDAFGFPPKRLLEKKTGKFLSPDKIRLELEHYDISVKTAIATFGDTGVWGALGWFALHQILENPKARLYDGSMVEWIDRGNEVHDSTDDMGGPIG